MLGGGTLISETALNLTLSQRHPAAKLKPKVCNAGCDGICVEKCEPSKRYLTHGWIAAVGKRDLNLSPNIICERPSGVEACLGLSILKLKGFATPPVRQGRRPTRWSVGERRNLVEHATCNSQRDAGMSDCGQSKDTEPVQVAAQVRSVCAQEMRIFLRHESVTNGVVNASASAKAKDIPIIFEFSLSYWDDENPHVGIFRPWKERRLAIFVDDGAAMNPLRVQDAAAVAPVAT